MEIVRTLHVVQDTDEKKPWLFDSSLATVTVAKLKTGDYSVLGLEDRITIERKSISDLIQSMTGDRARFMREVSRLARMLHACVVVEGSIGDLWRGCEGRGVEPENILAQAAALHAYRKIPVLFCSSRNEASTMAFHLLKQYACSVE